MASKDEVVEWLVEWFAQHGRLKRRVDSTVENFLEKGWLDSFGIIELLTDVESQFGVRFNEDYFLDPRFPTVDGLAEIISQADTSRKRGPRTGV